MFHSVTQQNCPVAGSKDSTFSTKPGEGLDTRKELVIERSLEFVDFGRIDSAVDYSGKHGKEPPEEIVAGGSYKLKD